MNAIPASSYFYCIAFLVMFSACKKNDGPLPPVDLIIEHPVELKYVDALDNSTCELIITDSLGVYLLDTMIASNQLLSTKVFSNQTKFNVTTIEYFPGRLIPYTVNTYYQVLLKKWNINQLFQLIQFGPEDQPLQSKITYVNTQVPNGGGRVPVFTSVSGMNSFGVQNDFQLFYKQPDPFSAYVLFPNSLLYSFTQTRSNNDTVDLAAIGMDTASELSSEKPFQVGSVYSELIGYRKKEDLSTYIKLWENFQDVSQLELPEFIYPKRGVEQYLARQQVSERFSDAIHYAQELSESMPSTLSFFNESSFTLTKADSIHYSIEFPNGDPTMYSVRIVNDNMEWRIVLPPSKALINDTAKMIDLTKAKLLLNVNISDAKPQSIELVQADNYSYQEYLDVIFNRVRPARPTDIRKYSTMASTKGLL